MLWYPVALISGFYNLICMAILFAWVWLGNGHFMSKITGVYMIYLLFLMGVMEFGTVGAEEVVS